tara:strand:- start:1154 stop:2119 length:966 start_codon:yes stop_codon:yes gene_type:complete
MPTTSSSSLSGFYSTSLNPRVSTYNKLATRVAYSLGYPQINIETHVDQVYDNIAQACEFFTKFAGYTEEFLIFDSKLYKQGEGLRLDTLFTVTPELSATYIIDDVENDAYTIGNMIIGDSSDPFKISIDGTAEVSKAYDYLLKSYRKVIDVHAFEEGTSSGVNTLFTLEQSMAQQTYFSYALGKYGFDLVSWYSLKEWLDVRKKLLSQEHYYRFDPRRQTLHLIPEPGIKASFYGLVACYVEKPLSDIVSELWVYHYALALTKITLGRIRGKYAGTSLFGGGSLDAGILQEGLEEKKELEQRLLENDPGYGDAAPPAFFVG